MRKYFILIIILAMTYALSAQENTAPFGGNLVEKHNIFSVVRSDGSKLTKLNGTWYLARESQSENALQVPKYVRGKMPMKITFVSENGIVYESYDRRNWVVVDQMESASSVNNSERSNLLTVTRAPENPIKSAFFIEFKLTKQTEVQLTIADMQGKDYITKKEVLQPGYHNFKLDVSNLSSGSYVYKITAGDSFHSDVLMKME